MSRLRCVTEVAMHKLLLTAATATAMALSSTGAIAAPIILSPAPAVNAPITPPASGTFGNSFNPATVGTFTDLYNFTLNLGSVADASLITLSLSGGNNIDFTCRTCSVLLDGTAFNHTTAGSLDVFTLNPTNLTSGPHTFTVNGEIVSGPTASYSGTFNFNVLPVPEPATWGLMLLGFLGIGMVVRRTRRPVLAQVA